MTSQSEKKDLMKMTTPRKTYEKSIFHHDGVDDVVATVRKENKNVTLLFTYIDSQCVDLRLKQKIDTSVPKIVQEYYMYMRGVYLLDSHLDLNRQKPQTVPPPILSPDESCRNKFVGTYENDLYCKGHLPQTTTKPWSVRQ